MKRNSLLFATALLIGLIGAPLIFFIVNAVCRKSEPAPEIHALWDKFRQL